MCLGLMHKDMAVFVHSIQVVSSLGAERVYSCTSRWFKLVGVYQLKPKILPFFFQQPVKSLNPPALHLFLKYGIEGERPSVQKASFCVQKASFASRTDASGHFLSLRLFFPQTSVWSVLGGIIIQSNPSFLNPFRIFRVVMAKSQFKWIRSATMVFNPKTFSFTHRCYQCFCTDWYH